MDLAAATATVAITGVVIAAEENDERKDYDPCAVVIKKTAKAVVIHRVSPFGRLFASSIAEYDCKKDVLQFNIFAVNYYVCFWLTGGGKNGRIYM